MGVRLIQPPVLQPLTIDEVKSNLRVDHNDDDLLLTEHLKSAVEWVEKRIAQKLMTQDWELVIDDFPSAEIKLPFKPVQSVLEIAYYDTGGVEQVVPSVDYYLDNVSRDSWVFPVSAWPTSLLTSVNVVRVRFRAGYSQKELVPGPVKSALHLRVQQLYDGISAEQAIHDLLTNYYDMVA